MGFPIPQAYPPGWVNPIVFRASAILLPAGAWDAAPLEIAVAGGRVLALSFAYTRGGAGGAVDYQMFQSPYSADRVLPLQSWYTQGLHAAGVVAAGVDTQSRIQRDYDTYQATGVAIETWTLDNIALESVERLRIRARESGNVGAPGLFEIIGYLEM